MKNEVKIIDTPELNAVEKTKADQIREAFEPMADMVDQFEQAHQNIIMQAANGITEQLTIDARVLRLHIAKIRTQTEKKRKEVKEKYLRAGKAIDGVSNILKWAITEKENQLKEIEDHFEIQRQKEYEALQLKRVELVAMYCPDAHERDLASMEPDVFDAFYNAKRKQYLEAKEAEKKALKEQKEREAKEAEERARIQAENDRLKKEAAEREKAAAAERKKQADQLAAEKKKAAEAAQKLREKEAAEAAKLKAEREEREKLLARDDETQMNALIKDLRALKNKYQFKAAKNQKLYLNIGLLIEKIVKYAKQ